MRLFLLLSIVPSWNVQTTENRTKRNDLLGEIAIELQSTEGEVKTMFHSLRSQLSEIRNAKKKAQSGLGAKEVEPPKFIFLSILILLYIAAAEGSVTDSMVGIRLQLYLFYQDTSLSSKKYFMNSFWIAFASLLTFLRIICEHCKVIPIYDMTTLQFLLLQRLLYRKYRKVYILFSNEKLRNVAVHNL